MEPFDIVHLLDGRVTMSPADVGKATGLGQTFIYEEMRDGHLKSFKMGKRRLVAADDLIEWIESYRQRAA